MQQAATSGPTPTPGAGSITGPVTGTGTGAGNGTGNGTNTGTGLLPTPGQTVGTPGFNLEQLHTYIYNSVVPFFTGLILRYVITRKVHTKYILKY